MSEAADDRVVRSKYRAISDALWQAASPQLRNMATLGGNVLQRTRCNYFRDVSWPCNKRAPGSGCSALDGVNRRLAVLGVSDQCIASYPGDFAHVLVAFEATVEHERRWRAAHDAVRGTAPAPGDTPHIETSLAPGDLITAFRVPAGAMDAAIAVRQGARPRIVRVRPRLGRRRSRPARRRGARRARRASAALTAVPWRSREAEHVLDGRSIDEAVANEAAAAAFADAVTHGDNAFKPELGRRTLVRALLEAAALGEID